MEAWKRHRSQSLWFLFGYYLTCTFYQTRCVRRIETAGGFMPRFGAKQDANLLKQKFVN